MKTLFYFPPFFSPTMKHFNSITNLISNCNKTKHLKCIQTLHAHLITTNLFSLASNLQTNLIYSYTQCLNQQKNIIITTLTHLFKSLNPQNPLPFNSIISRFSQNGLHAFALHAFSCMHFGSVYIDSYALCCCITSSIYVEDGGLYGEIMHGFVVRLGWLRSVFVGCSLIDMYGKFLRVGDAVLVFDEMPERNVVCVNALLSGYVEGRRWGEGLELVRNVSGLGLECDSLTLSGALRACAGMPAMELGRQVHGFVVGRVLDVVCDVHLLSLLIEMYGKCGLVGKARQVFEKLGFERGGEGEKDVVLWTSMLGAYGRNGDFEEVIKLFRVMLIEGTRPDGISFLTVISACGHCGQVELGMEYFESMTRDFGLTHDPEHYSCVIDLLCRAGELDKAWKLVCEMPHVENMNHTIALWGSLLSACYECGNVELGKLAAQKALELEPQNVGIYLLLSNIYAKNGMWDDIGQLREAMNERGVKKNIGRSWVDLST